MEVGKKIILKLPTFILKFIPMKPPMTIKDTQRDDYKLERQHLDTNLRRMSRFTRCDSMRLCVRSSRF